MLKRIYSISALDAEQLLSIYKDHEWNSGEFLTYLDDDFFRQKGAFYAIWIEGTVYKSAVRLEPYSDGLLLHSLETAPEARRMGYAHNLLTALISCLQTEGFSLIYSHIDKRNRASVALHKKCGFEIISDSATFIDGTVTQYCYTARIRL